jgi:DNA-binding beta-propeller fold protein YncE
MAVVDKSGRIQVFSAKDEFLIQWEMPRMDNGTPTGLIWDATDPTTLTLIVADTHNSRIARYSEDGRLLKMFGEYGGEPGQMIYPTDAAVDEKGFIYVTEYGINDRVLKFDREGTFVKQWGSFGQQPGQFQRAIGLIFAPPDKIIVADSCNHRVQIFTTEGELLSVWGKVGREPGEMNYPYDLALGPDGLLYVCEFGNNRVQCFNLAGESQGCYGRAGTAPGEFGTPWGIALAKNGELYVTDTNNHRLQAIKPDAIRKNKTVNAH